MPFSLFGNRNKSDEKPQQKIEQLALTAIEPNRFQPRQVFDEHAIAELAETIKAHGLLQPIVVREYETGKYEIIAGERRFRAVTSLNWETIPAIVEKMDDHETASLALIENLQREELSAVEEAQAYQQLMALNDVTQTQLAKGVGKSQSAVANKLRLLKLSQPVLDAISAKKISERHGRALLPLNADQQRHVLMQIEDRDMNVKATERLVSELTTEKPVTPQRPKKRLRGLTSDTRIAVNTIKESAKMIRDTGLSVHVHEENTDDGYRIVIDLPKDGHSSSKN
ncbi:nucleoid occlusion protein [Furfurilactobacillus milii]|uniref:Nucleoid occlusion protein n=1 Tax=Furfurilactobacillus milii TaxID=2888272 RepID=A0A6N9I626_9LACO|nr:nucleoid occlusion protein [Furfurilactobacillus milii]MYV17723.1 nucleoid occlusion protein [Furfurilactobacillus milii]